MYQDNLRDFLGTLVDTFVYHPFTNRFRFARLKLWFWKTFRRGPALKEWINLGAGPAPTPGFCNVDATGPSDLRFNLLCRFPFSDNSVKGVFSEHTFEHFHVQHVRHIIAEIFRILQPGGTVRISVPPVQLDASKPAKRRTWPIDDLEGATLERLNHAMFDHEHRTFYTEKLLLHLLATTGFPEVSTASPGRGVWFPTNLVVAAETRGSQENLIIEARKGPTRSLAQSDHPEQSGRSESTAIK